MGRHKEGLLSPFLFNILVERLVSLRTNVLTRDLSYLDDIVVVSSGANHVDGVRAAAAGFLSAHLWG